jgi:RND family efflux transporter MFP subunit
MKLQISDKWRSLVRHGAGRGYRWGWLPALMLVGAAAIAWSDGGQTSSQPKSEMPAPIPCVDVCQIKSLKEVVLAFDRPGILGKLDLQEGNSVESGQFLAGLKDNVARAALAVAQIQADSDAEIIYAELASKVAETEHEQMLEANTRKPGLIPLLEVRRAKLNYDKTVAEANKARQNREVLMAKRDEAAAQLDTYRLEAPFDGIITRLHLVEGASVKQGDPVVELVNTRAVRVEGNIQAKDAAVVQPGCSVEVQLAKPKNVGEAAAARSFKGKLVFVDVAKATAVSGTVRVWAEVDNPDKLLRAGLTATMTIQPARNSD